MWKILDVIGAAFILIGAALVGIAFVFGIYWCLWSLWCFVVPQVWTSAPENVMHPSFWLFAGAWFLAIAIRKLVFGKRKA